MLSTKQWFSKLSMLRKGAQIFENLEIITDFLTLSEHFLRRSQHLHETGIG